MTGPVARNLRRLRQQCLGAVKIAELRLQIFLHRLPVFHSRFLIVACESFIALHVCKVPTCKAFVPLHVFPAILLSAKDEKNATSKQIIAGSNS